MKFCLLAHTGNPPKLQKNAIDWYQAKIPTFIFSNIFWLHFYYHTDTGSIENQKVSKFGLQKNFSSNCLLWTVVQWARAWEPTTSMTTSAPSRGRTSSLCPSCSSSSSGPRSAHPPSRCPPTTPPQVPVALPFTLCSENSSFEFKVYSQIIVSDPYWIRIQSDQWIRIQEDKNDPQK